jgi:hypothetical protein
MEDNHPVLYEGYVQYVTENSTTRVFVVLKNDKIYCFNENSSLRIKPVLCFELKNTSIEEAADLKNPKAFSIISAKGTPGEITCQFVCATNSMKFQWVKCIQDSKKLLSLNPNGYQHADFKTVNSPETSFKNSTGTTLLASPSKTVQPSDLTLKIKKKALGPSIGM